MPAGDPPWFNHQCNCPHCNNSLTVVSWKIPYISPEPIENLVKRLNQETKETIEKIVNEAMQEFKKTLEIELKEIFNKHTQSAFECEDCSDTGEIYDHIIGSTRQCDCQWGL